MRSLITDKQRSFLWFAWRQTRRRLQLAATLQLSKIAPLKVDRDRITAELAFRRTILHVAARQHHEELTRLVGGRGHKNGKCTSYAPERTGAIPNFPSPPEHDCDDITRIWREMGVAGRTIRRINGFCDRTLSRYTLGLPPNVLQNNNLSDAERLMSGHSTRERVFNLQRQLRVSLENPDLLNELSRSDSGRERLANIRECLENADIQLSSPPQISVAFLGPSRHGKSTLLNALAATSVLPMSDVRPCTASVVKLEWASQWELEIKFVSKDQLLADWRFAVKDAEDYLARQKASGLQGEEPDDPRHMQKTLQRFIELFQIDPQQPASALLEAVRKNTIKGDKAQLLGQTITKSIENPDSLRRNLSKYLSTEDVYWTLVESCIIRGPFPDWHEQLALVDLPGTNDTNAERARITANLRADARAAAIVTSDSNLGVDIESWLRDSSVLTQFLEAREGTYQRLLIIRTKFDAYHPEITGTYESEEQELEAYRAAIEKHKREQTESYHKMLQDIASPMMPVGESEQERQKLELLRARIRSIPVFFVSAHAHEAFHGRLAVPSRTKARLSEHFNDDPNATGIPSLRDYFNDLAREFVDRGIYEDLESQLLQEIELLVSHIKQQRTLVEAELAGGGKAVRTLIATARDGIIPWMQQEVSQKANAFRESAKRSADELKRKMQQIESLSNRRLKDKVDKWKVLAWNTLRATARRSGCHTNAHGETIDIVEDICSVLVDELIIGWSTYRDDIIQSQVSQLTQDVADELTRRLQGFAEQMVDEQAQAAIHQVIDHLSRLTHRQQRIVVQQIEALVRRLESIRVPAMEVVRRQMEPVFHEILSEWGHGCQERMRRRLVDGFHQRSGAIRSRINEMIEVAINELLNGCSTAMGRFAAETTSCLYNSLNQVQHTLEVNKRQEVEERLERLGYAYRALPAIAH